MQNLLLTSYTRSTFQTCYSSHNLTSSNGTNKKKFRKRKHAAAAGQVSFEISGGTNNNQRKCALIDGGRLALVSNVWQRVEHLHVEQSEHCCDDNLRLSKAKVVSCEYDERCECTFSIGLQLCLPVFPQLLILNVNNLPNEMDICEGNSCCPSTLPLRHGSIVPF